MRSGKYSHGERVERKVTVDSIVTLAVMANNRRAVEFLGAESTGRLVISSILAALHSRKYRGLRARELNPRVEAKRRHPC